MGSFSGFSYTTTLYYQRIEGLRPLQFAVGRSYLLHCDPTLIHVHSIPLDYLVEVYSRTDSVSIVPVAMPCRT
jgi:hypothetical protein